MLLTKGEVIIVRLGTKKIKRKENKQPQAKEVLSKEVEIGCSS